MPDPPATDSTDLERLWAGDFGNDYVERNAANIHGRKGWWEETIARLEPRNILEIGCNIGGNLRPLSEILGVENVAGVDVNASALEVLRAAVPGIDVRHATGRALPFEDASFDVTFTMGVLIHQGPVELEPMMREIVRCSRRHIICVEYFAEEDTEVPYRGQTGALFQRNYGGIYQRLFPELELLDTGYLPRSKEASWDDATWWIFEKPAA